MGPRCRRDRRLSVIYRGAELRVAPRGLKVLCLCSSGRDMVFPTGVLLFRSRSSIHSAISTVVTHARDVYVSVLDSRVVYVVHHRDIHIVDFPIVEKVPVLPAPAFVTTSEIAVSVVDAAIETHSRPPIS